ncbi:hypothetical protein TKWG_16815 [Advenella kashmirensis WT001]|uniref:Uncharacterized protein n=1 Tax=Advenella kashmirensis (strain DSM 17095 / LMG 22695 / WT001) TaxID=1036672 RepID=I3UE51_ADVKW|nr:hypothetical protein TKWG_16815 [Advenella kashmirensis WT001]
MSFIQATAAVPFALVAEIGSDRLFIGASTAAGDKDGERQDNGTSAKCLNGHVSFSQRGVAAIL